MGDGWHFVRTLCRSIRYWTHLVNSREVVLRLFSLPNSCAIACCRVELALYFSLRILRSFASKQMSVKTNVCQRSSTTILNSHIHHFLLQLLQQEIWIWCTSINRLSNSKIFFSDFEIIFPCFQIWSGNKFVWPLTILNTNWLWQTLSDWNIFTNVKLFFLRFWRYFWQKCIRSWNNKLQGWLQRKSNLQN